MKLDAFLDQLAEEFGEWVDGITNFGELLAKLWFNRAVMKSVYTNFWLWNEAVRELDKSSAAYSRQQSAERTVEIVAAALEICDPKLRSDHDNIELLRQFAETYEGNYGDRLLLQHLTVGLKDLYEEIRGLRDRAQDVPLTLNENLRLRLLTEDFMRDHMIWYSALPVRSIPSVKNLCAWLKTSIAGSSQSSQGQHPGFHCQS